MLEWPAWTWGYVGTDRGGKWKSNGALDRALHNAVSGKGLSWTDEMKDDISKRIRLTIKQVGLQDKPETIRERFLEAGFCENFVEAQRTISMRGDKRKRRK
jgi:hypothetical protein